LFSDLFGSLFRLRLCAADRGIIEGKAARIAGSVQAALRSSFGAGGGSEICFDLMCYNMMR